MFSPDANGAEPPEYHPAAHVRALTSAPVFSSCDDNKGVVYGGVTKSCAKQFAHAIFCPSGKTERSMIITPVFLVEEQPWRCEGTCWSSPSTGVTSKD